MSWRSSIGALVLAMVMPAIPAAAQVGDSGKYPNFKGQWIRPPGTPNNWIALAGPPPLTPEYEKIWDGIKADLKAGGPGNWPSTFCIPAGMPAGMQKVEGQLPGPPALRSALMPSQIFSYSGVSGGGPARAIQLLGVPGGRIHWPLKFGYLPESPTCAAAGIAGITMASTSAPIELRQLIGIPPLHSRPLRRFPSLQRTGARLHHRARKVEGLASDDGRRMG